MTNENKTQSINADEVAQALVKFTATEAGLIELKAQFGSIVFAVDTPEGMKEAREARQKIRKPRYAVENLRKDAKAPIIALGKKLDARAKELTAEILALESPIDEQITTEENKVEAARIEEENRIQDLRERTDQFERAVDEVRRDDATLAEIMQCADRINAIVIDESFSEFEDNAKQNRDKAVEDLRGLYLARNQRDQDAAELETLRREKAERDEADAKEAERKQQVADAAQKSVDDSIAAKVEPVVEDPEAKAETVDTSNVVVMATVKSDEPPLAAFEAPSRAEMIQVLADHYGVANLQIHAWLEGARPALEDASL